MNDEEIKKCLEYCVAKGQCKKCPLDKELLCFPVLEKNALDLINRQQERIEELEIITGLANNRKYYRKFVDEVFCKQKGNELSEPDFDYIYQLYFEQQAEIERLTRLLDQWKKVACKYIDSIENIKSEAIKECVNKYTEMLIDEYHLRTDLQIASIKRLEQKVLTEMVGGENA